MKLVNHQGTDVSDLTEFKILKITGEGMTAQGCKSLFENGDCAYRGGNSTACGVGFLMTDDEATYQEGCIGTLIEEDYDTYSRFAPFEQLLSKIQKIHDEDPISTWTYFLSRLAEDYLEKAELEQLSYYEELEV